MSDPTQRFVSLEGTIGLATDLVHVLVVPGLRFVNLRLLDFEHQPLADLGCVLHVASRLVHGRTDPEARVAFAVRGAATEGEGLLEIANDIHGYRPARAIRLGEIAPVDTPEGQRIRLDNLGYIPVEGPDDDAETPAAWAIEEFQCEHGLTVDGVCGPATQSKLAEVHGH